MRKKELPDSGNPSMTCLNEACDEHLILYSACRGDYFMYADDHLMVCSCGELMHLAREVTQIEILS